MTTPAAAFARDGFAIVRRVVSDDTLAAIDGMMAADVRDTVGSRALLAQPWCAALAASLRADPRVATLLPPDHVAVQCTSFEKSVGRNWLVPVHQDVSMAVAARIDHPALTGWSLKQGTWHVQPPVALLGQLVAIRLHLDDCSPSDGPLLVVPGSHRAGRLTDDAAIALRRAAPPTACTVERGGAMAMRPLLLHASAKATGASRRRVLHFLYGPRALPYGLRWPEAGIAAA